MDAPKHRHVRTSAVVWHPHAPTATAATSAAHSPATIEAKGNTFGKSRSIVAAATPKDVPPPSSLWTRAGFFHCHQLRLTTPRRADALRAALRSLCTAQPRPLGYRRLFCALTLVEDPVSPMRQAFGEIRVSHMLLAHVRQRYPHDKELHTVAALHAVGKVLALGATGWAPCFVFGTCRPLGAPVHDKDILLRPHKHEAWTPPKDAHGHAGRCPYARQGFASMALTPNHAVEAADILQPVLSPRAWRLLRMSTFDAWHTFHAYLELEDREDEALRYDLGFQALCEGLAWLEHPPNHLHHLPQAMQVPCTAPSLDVLVDAVQHLAPVKWPAAVVHAGHGTDTKETAMTQRVCL